MDYKSRVNIEDHQVEIILKLMESFRSQIMAWHDRAYVAAIGSMGLILMITKLWIETEHKKPLVLIGYAGAIVLFEILTQFYLRSIRHNYMGNEEGKQRCEYTLRLKDEDVYFSEDRFFGKGQPGTDTGLPSRDINFLIIGHIVASAFLAFVCVIAIL